MLNLKKFTSYNQEEIDLLLKTKWIDRNKNIYSGSDLLNLELDGSKLDFKTVDWFLTQLDINKFLIIKDIEFTFCNELKCLIE